GYLRLGALKVLLVDVGLPGDPHADALVELRGAGLVGGVDGEADPRLATPVEVAERGQEQGTAQPAASPRLQRAEGADPPAAEAHRVDLGGDHVVPRADKVDQRRIPPRRLEHRPLPTFEVPLTVAPA